MDWFTIGPDYKSGALPLSYTVRNTVTGFEPATPKYYALPLSYRPMFYSACAGPGGFEPPSLVSLWAGQPTRHKAAYRYLLVGTRMPSETSGNTLRAYCPTLRPPLADRRSFNRRGRERPDQRTSPSGLSSLVSELFRNIAGQTEPWRVAFNHSPNAGGTRFAPPGSQAACCIVARAGIEPALPGGYTRQSPSSLACTSSVEAHD